MGDVTEAAAERAAKAVIDAGRHWEEFKLAVLKVQETKLTENTVIALISDECELSMDQVRSVLDAFIQFPDKFCTRAA